MNAHCRIEFSDDRWGPTAFSASKDADFDHGWKTAKSALQLGRLKPGRTYSKRSSRLAQLRNDAAALSKLDLEEVTPPSIMSMHAARTFINGLCEGCLDFDLEIFFVHTRYSQVDLKVVCAFFYVYRRHPVNCFVRP